MLHVTETGSGLDVHFTLLPDKAPAALSFLHRLLERPVEIAGIHAMWTGPEISCPVPFALVPQEARGALPVENGTVQPQPGELVLSYVPPRMWGGGPDPVFDIGLFYGPGARLLFPIGWLPGSVVAKILPGELDGFAGVEFNPRILATGSPIMLDRLKAMMLTTKSTSTAWPIRRARKPITVQGRCVSPRDDPMRLIF